MTLALGLLALGLSGADCYTVPVAGAGGTLKATSRRPLEFSAWVVFWDDLSVKSFLANVTRLKRVYPEAYGCQADGLPAHIGTFDAAAMATVVTAAKAHGVKVLGTMNNFANGDFEPKRVEKFLNNPALMEKHVDALIALAKADGLDGLDVDYESLDASDRGGFTAFVRRLAEKCHAQGLQVGLAAHPKVSEPGTWGGPQAQDYEALGAAVDHFHVMTYDYHWATGGAGSIAPLAWVRQVTEFAKSKMAAEKVEVGVNGYGYYWHPKGENLTWPGFLALQAKLGKAQRDDDSQELKLYSAAGEAYMADALTSLEKFKIARDEEVGGVALWVLGQEDPKTWMVWDKFQ